MPILSVPHYLEESAMKKLLPLCALLLTACQTTPPPQLARHR